jgi:hypothetical protein
MPPDLSDREIALLAAHRARPRDPLKIYYIVLLPEVPLEAMSPFQGFQLGWRQVDWALGVLTLLPADILEIEGPLYPLISQRMGGARHLSWSPLWITALEKLTAIDLGLFVVLFSGTDEIARRAEQWRSLQEFEVLHVSASNTPGLLHPSKLSTSVIVSHCRTVLKAEGSRLDESRRETAAAAIANWRERESIPIDLKGWGHDVVTPNQMSLVRSNRLLQDGEPFVGKSEAEYNEIILQSAKAVFQVREQAGIRPFHLMWLIHPEVYLAEPALFRHAYRRVGPGRIGDRAAKQVMRLFQTQTGFLAQATTELPKALQSSSLAGDLVAIRMSELRTFALGVGLAAAQTGSAVLRMSPGVNRVFPALSAFARSVRSEKYEHRHKAFRLYQNIQDQLSEAVGKEKLTFIEEEVNGPIKIVADAPLEWLPVGNLPLLIRHECSRINATPGNLLMGLLAQREVITVLPEVLQDVLIVSAFDPADSLRNMLSQALEILRPRWEGKVKVRFQRVQTVRQFIESLNGFEGAILIFDGHGIYDDGNGIGKLAIGKEQVDVWSLRGQVRAPPIVILSACDTHGLDSPSHATVGNGFLFLGATTVVASLLPLGGANSAEFIARFVHRLADFIPAALSVQNRVLNWAGLVSGMQRMFLASETLNALVGPPDVEGSPRQTLQLQANVHINSYEPDWFDKLLAGIAEHRNEELGDVARRAARAIAVSEAIRYIQLGHPESILIDDGSIRAQFVPEHLQAQWNAFYDEGGAAQPAPQVDG